MLQKGERRGGERRGDRGGRGAGLSGGASGAVSGPILSAKASSPFKIYYSPLARGVPLLGGLLDAVAMRLARLVVRSMVLEGWGGTKMSDLEEREKAGGPAQRGIHPPQPWPMQRAHLGLGHFTGALCSAEKLDQRGRGWGRSEAKNEEGGLGWKVLPRKAWKSKFRAPGPPCMLYR
jgi:hypothetical protein